MANRYTCNNYSSDEINEIISLYVNGMSFSEIGIKLKRKKPRIREILKDEGVWVEGRDTRKKSFNEKEIKNILNLYLNEMWGTRKISQKYNVSVGPIKRILVERNLLRKGNSDGKKIHLSDDQMKLIKELYLNEDKNPFEIGDILGLNGSFMNKYLTTVDYRRTKSVATSIALVKRSRGISYEEYLKDLPKYKKYKGRVLSITNKQPINTLTNFEKRGVSGCDGTYHLDHKYSMLMGFNNNIEPEIIGNILNLEFLPWEENAKKRANCSITENELNMII